MRINLLQKHHLQGTDQNKVFFWQDNYFVLAGLHISDELVANINPLLEEEEVLELSM